jgi:aminoglycoside 6'-N-acetyltransferase
MNISQSGRANRRAVRAYEKAGFRAIPRLLGRTGDALIMQYDSHKNDPDR